MFTQVADPVGGSLALSASRDDQRRQPGACHAFRRSPPSSTNKVISGSAATLAVAVFAFGMPAGQALLAASEGAAFGLFPIIWIVLTAIWVFKLTEMTGYDVVLRQAFGSLSPDLRIQAVIIAFCFGALLEALAGFGTPVAVTAVMLLAIGLSPLRAATVTLVANTAPVAFGAIAVPITTLGKITGLDPHALGAMVGRQTPILALFVPLILVLMVDGRRGVRQTWPAAAVGGGAFAVAQFAASNYLAYETADIVAAFAGALALVVLLRVWQPVEVVAAERAPVAVPTGGGAIVEERLAEPLTARRALLAFAPYLVVVVLFTLASFGPLKAFLDAHSGWTLVWPGLHVLGSAGKPVSATTFTLNIFSAGGTVLLVSGLVTAAIYRLHPRWLVRAFADVVVQFRWTILTVVLVLALAYVMNLSRQTVTLGLALAATGGFFAFLSPVVGWLGVAVTGSDTSANSLFGLLQTTAAARTGISPVLLAAANTSGGVLGKMLSPQNLAIGAAVVGMAGRESELFRKVVGWSLVLLLGMSLLVFLQSTPVLGWMVVAR